MTAQDGDIARVRAELVQARRMLASKNKKILELREKLVRTGQSRRLPSLPYGNIPIFFLVGRGRSGTTWLQDVLNSHPEVLCRGEGYVFDRNFRWSDFKELHPRLKPASLYNAIANDEYLRLWAERSVWGVGEDPDQHLDNLTRLAVNYFLGRKLERTNARIARTDPKTSVRKRIVGDKTPFVSGEVLYEMNVHQAGEPHREEAPVPYNGAEVLGEIARVYRGGEGHPRHPRR